MAFLTINSFDVPVADDSFNVNDNILGSTGRAFSGKPLSARRGTTHAWQFSTPPVVPTIGNALRRLFLGDGHVWSFNDSSDFLYSARGIGPTAGTTANGAYQATAIKFGAGSVDITANTYVQWNVGYDFGWTVMVWEGASPTHYIVDSLGRKWEDGVRNDAASTPFITMTGGNFRLGDTANGSLQKFDDLVVLPYVLDTTMAEAFGTATVAFSALPTLNTTGKTFNDQSWKVQCFDTATKYVQGSVDGTFYPNLHIIDFALISEERVS